MLGKEFNENYGSNNYIKLTNECCSHNNFQYEEGLNTDTKEFDITGSCNETGLHFSDYNNLVKWLHYGNNNHMHYIWDVSIPDDALVIFTKEAVKCNKFILSNKRSIWDNNDMCMEIVKKEGLFLHYVTNQTEEICIEAIKQNSISIGFVENQTHNVYCEFIKLDANNIKHIPEYELTDKLCEKLLKVNIDVLPFIKSPSEEMLIIIVQNDGMRLKDIKKQTQNICMEAVKQNKKCFKHVQIDYRDQCKTYIKSFYDKLRAESNMQNI